MDLNIIATGTASTWESFDRWPFDQGATDGAYVRSVVLRSSQTECTDELPSGEVIHTVFITTVCFANLTREINICAGTASTIHGKGFFGCRWIRVHWTVQMCDPWCCVLANHNARSNGPGWRLSTCLYI